MLTKFSYLRESLHRIAKEAPMELIACIMFYVVAVISFSMNDKAENWLWSFPACFCLIFVVNRLTVASPTRWVYYLSGFFIPGFWLWDLPLDSSMFWITLLVSQLLVLLTVRQPGNERFVGNALCYVGDMAGAIVLSFLGWLLAVAIYWSVVYIFDLQAEERRYMVYSSQAAFFLLAPVLFLMFHSHQKEGFYSNSFFRVLVNFILSPALLAYNVVLYLYFVKIALAWSLPKGWIAGMVLSFVTLLFMTKAAQTVLQRRFYDWYYNHFSLWVLPPLVMLWISISHRIGAYGWTEWRIYLMLSALVATVAMVLFFYAPWRRFKWVVLFAAGLLVLFTYVPGMNARTLALHSQERRISGAMEQLYDRKQEKWTHDTDSVTFERYKMLYHSFIYVQNLESETYMRAKYGFTRDELRHLIPLDAMERIDGREADRESLSLSFYGNQEVDIAGYDTLYRVDSYSKSDVYYRFKNGILTIYKHKEVLVTLDLEAVVRERLVEKGLEKADGFDYLKFEREKLSFRTYPQGNKLIVLNNLSIDVNNFTLKSATPQFVLVRKE